MIFDRVVAKSQEEITDKDILELDQESISEKSGSNQMMNQSPSKSRNINPGQPSFNE